MTAKRKKDKVVIRISKKVRERLRRLGIVGESYDTVIKRIIYYIEFHPEYWNRND